MAMAARAVRGAWGCVASHRLAVPAVPVPRSNTRARPGLSGSTCGLPCGVSAAGARVLHSSNSEQQQQQQPNPRPNAQLPANLLRELGAHNDAASAKAVASTVGTLLAALAAPALSGFNPLVVVPSLLVIAARQHALFVLAHDAAHGRLFKSQAANDFVGSACGSVVGISMKTYRIIHRVHHKHLYGPEDPDTPLHGGYPRGRRYLIRKLAKDFLGGTAVKTYSYFFFGVQAADGASSQSGSAEGTAANAATRLWREALLDRRWVAAFHVCAPLVALASGCGLQYLLLWVFPLLSLLPPILRLRAICEHGAPGPLDSPLTAARTNLAPGYIRFFLFPHNVNYHIEHHVFPHVPFCNLPRLHDEMTRLGLLNGAQVLSFGDTLRRIFADPAGPSAPSAAGSLPTRR